MATLSESVQAALTSHVQKLRALPSPQAQDGAPAVERLTWAAVRELLSEADAWKSLQDTPRGGHGLYLRKPRDVRTRQMSETFFMRVGEAGNPIVGAPGDWAVQYSPTHRAIVADQVFQETYALTQR